MRPEVSNPEKMPVLVVTAAMSSPFAAVVWSLCLGFCVLSLLVLPCMILARHLLKRQKPYLNYLVLRKKAGTFVPARSVPAYRNRASTLLGAWLACARTEMPACCRIIDLVIFAVSAAKSASMMRDLAAVMFSLVPSMLRMVDSKRFSLAPSFAF